MVDFGAFQERHDAHLPIRKAAFQALNTLLLKLKTAAATPQFYAAVARGLKDEEHEINLASFQIIEHALTIDSVGILNVLDSFTQPFMDRIKPLLKPLMNNDKPEEKRIARSVITSCLVLMHNILKLPNVQRCSGFMRYHQVILKTKVLAPILQEIVVEKKS